MLTHLLTLALAVGLAAGPAAPAPPVALDTAGTSRDFDKPPPGSAADQALWQSAHDMNNDLLVEQNTASTTMFQAKAIVELLRDPARRGALTPERAEELAKPVVAKWTAEAEIVGAIWPVSKLRVCRNELMNFEGVLFGADSPAKEVQLADTRRDLSACMGKATTVFSRLRNANEELAAANAEALRALGSPPAEKATAAAPSPKP